jgi:bifunctional DNA-binding transcriptional regulator/antitoxin component of YhaV-PrlF toxin-antitoxin module
MVVRIGKGGAVTLPKALRERYALQVGDHLTLLDLEGVLVLSRQRTQIDALAEGMTQTVTARGESLQSMQQDLRELREGGGAGRPSNL